MDIASKKFGRLGNRLFQSAYIYSQFLDGVIPDIYLQDPKYFEKHEPQVKELFRQDIPKQNSRVAIHVRRGDYVNNPFYIDLTQTDYYEKALAEFPLKRFLIFSDDIDFCKEYFIGDEYDFNEECESNALLTMASCSGHIIANSSFSWWGAYLSPYTQKVISPEKWFTDGISRVGIPKSWKTL